MKPTILFRKMEETDISLVIHWIKQPHVHKYWYSAWNKSDQELYNKYKKRLNNSHIETYIIRCNQQDIGLIQTYFLTANNAFFVTQPAKGIDLFIGEKSFVGKGIGTLVLELFIEQHVFNHPHVEVACIDPELANKRAIHVYEKVGFVQKHINIDHESGLLTCYMIKEKNKRPS